MNWRHELWSALASARERLMGPPAPRPGLRLLGYHSIGARRGRDPYGLSVLPAAFARQMERLASGEFGKPVSLSGAGLDGRGLEIAVTFDDGYADALTTAAPILSRLALPFTVCVTPGLLDSGPPHLSWPELKELSRVEGCQIGAHGLTHARLDSLDLEDLERELTGSRRRLEDALGLPVKVMTWPHGAASLRAAEAARAAGFTRAACSLYGLNAPGRNGLLLKRVEITDFDDETDFRRKASGGWDWYALRQKDPAAR